MSDSQASYENPNEGVGAKLKALRLEKNLDVEEFAKLSVIPVSKVYALEEEEYRKVGTETFVIGYIRKYATWLEADADALVNEYKSQVGESALPEVLVSTEQPLADSAPSKPEGKKGLNPVPSHVDHPEGQFVKKLKAIPAWSILAVLVVLWLIGAYVFVPSESSKAGAANPPESVAQRSEEKPELPEEKESLELSQETPVSVVEREISIGQQVQAAEVDAADNTAAVIEADQVPVSPTSIDSTESTAAQQSAQPAAMEVGQAESAGINTDTLFMTFTDECWVEVSDANGKKIFAAVQKSEDTLSLVGRAPFEIMLGNARAASVVFNGEVVEVKPRSGYKTLRFTVEN